MKTLILSLLIFFSQMVSANPVYTSYLTGDSFEDVPTTKRQNSFDCSQKVYLVVEMSGMEGDEHRLQVKWFDPRNKLEENTHYKFNYLGDGTRIWAWLRLSGPPGAAIGRVFDPSFGMGSFIGNWKADVLIDDEKISTLKFEVLC